VVIDEFDILRASFSPDKTDAPPGIYPDAVLTSTVAKQPLQAISWRYPKIFDVLGRMDQLELPQGRALHRSVYTLDVMLMPDALGIFATKRSDHTITV
jgi:hypothetical protein